MSLTMVSAFSPTRVNVIMPSSSSSGISSSPSTMIAPRPSSLASHLQMSNTDPNTAREAINYLKSQKFEQILPKQEALSILNELLNEKQLIDDSEQVLTRNWQKLQSKLENEQRSIAEILGTETTNQILDSVQNINGYDKDAVQAFLQSEAVNQLLAQILYDGIYNFFQTIDVFGNIIGNLPIIGPIRNQIRDETKRQLDRTVGPLIQSFLKSYTKTAVMEVSVFVLSPKNQQMFAMANVKLVKNVLGRPVNSLVPGDDLGIKLIRDSVEYLKNVEQSDLEDYVDFIYDLLGDKALDDAFNVNRIIDASPTMQKSIDRVWNDLLYSKDDGNEEN